MNGWARRWWCWICHELWIHPSISKRSRCSLLSLIFVFSLLLVRIILQKDEELGEADACGLCSDLHSSHHPCGCLSNKTLIDNKDDKEPSLSRRGSFSERPVTSRCGNNNSSTTTTTAVQCQFAGCRQYAHGGFVEHAHINVRRLVDRGSCFTLTTVWSQWIETSSESIRVDL